MNNSDEIRLMFKKIHGKLKNSMDYKLGLLELTYPQFSVLIFIASSGDRGVSQKDICQHTGLKHSTVNGIINRLFDKGLVIRTVDESNRKLVKIKATEKSLYIEKELKLHKKGIKEKLLRYIPESDRLVLLDMLKRVSLGMDEEGK